MHGWCADSPLRRVRLSAECERLRSEVALLREELRIKDARLALIPARERPQYPPAERLAILALRAARGWNTWLVDLTIMPTVAGFWVPWLPFAFLQRWPFCWWIVAVIDHFSRAAVGHAEFRQQPTTDDVIRVLDRAVERAGRAPKHVITDHGAQFQNEYRAWCARRGVRPRFGAVGKYGSILSRPSSASRRSPAAHTTHRPARIRRSGVDGLDLV